MGVYHCGLSHLYACLAGVLFYVEKISSDMKGDTLQAFTFGHLFYSVFILFSTPYLLSC